MQEQEHPLFTALGYTRTSHGSDKRFWFRLRDGSIISARSHDFGLSWAMTLWPDASHWSRLFPGRSPRLAIAAHFIRLAEGAGIYTGPEAVPGKAGRPVGSRDSYQRVRTK